MTAAQQLPLRLEERLAGPGERSQADDLHRTERIAALGAFVAFTEAWGHPVPDEHQSVGVAWAEFARCLQFGTSIRTVVCTTNAIAASMRGSVEPSTGLLVSRAGWNDQAHSHGPRSRHSVFPGHYW